MSLSLMTVSTFVFEKKVLSFVLTSVSIFLNSKNNVIANLKPFKRVKKSIS